MSVFFTHPWYGLFALALVPLLIHLFARARPPAYWFPSVEFIQRILRKTLRVKRPRDWLLWLLRTLLTLAMVLLILGPILMAGRAGPGAGLQRNLVLVVDATASMAYSDGAQTRFAAACAEASEVLRGLRSLDRANIVWLKSVPAAVFPELGVNLGQLQDELRRARVSSETGSPEAALRLAADLLRGATGRKAICLLSDFHRTGWADFRPELPADIELTQIRIGQGEASNQALLRLSAEPPRPLRGEETTLLCEVVNYSAQPQHKTVFLTAGEARSAQDLVLPPWGRATAAFRHSFREAGPAVVSAALGEDAFSGDDRRWLAVTVTDRLRVGLYDAEPATARAWRRVLAAMDWVQLQPLSDADLDGALPFDAVLLSGWAGRGGAGLQAFRRRGGRVLWCPGRDLEATAWQAGAGQAAAGAPVWQKLTKPMRLTVADRNDRLFAIFQSGNFGDPARGLFLARWTLPAPLPPQAQRLLDYADGQPALVRWGLADGLFIWNLPLDPKLSNWSRQDEFILLFAELIRGARQGGGEPDYRPGQSLAWQPDQDSAATEVQLVTADGRNLPVTERHEAGVRRFYSAPIAQPGPYAWRFKDQLLRWEAVNFPEVESDLRAQAPAELRRSAVATVTSGARLRQLQEGVPLWPWMLAAAAALALLEGLAGWWSERT